MNFFRIDSPFMKAAAYLGNLVLLSLLWTLCALPIVTAGAGTVALYGVLLTHGASDLDAPKHFWHTFRQSWRQATVLWCVILLSGVVLWVDYSLLTNGMISLPNFQYVIPAVGLALLCWAAWLFPLCARFQSPTLTLCRNAARLAIGQLPKTLLAAFCTAIPFLVFWHSPVWFLRLILFWPLLGAGLIAWVNSHLFSSTLRQISPRPPALPPDDPQQ